MKKIITILYFLVLSSNVFATAQYGDILIYEGKIQKLFTNPLESYFNEQRPRPEKIFGFSCTANWRGYIATWEIKENELYLTKLVKGTCAEKPPEIPLTEIFPNQQIPIKATWFSGMLKMPFGERLQYVQMGYGSVYEKELLFTIEKGVVISKKLVDNSNEELPTEHEITLEELRKLNEWESQLHSSD